MSGARDKNNTTSSEFEVWDIIIRPSGAAGGHLSTVWKYRELVWMFFKRDFTAFYKQTVLGPIWYIIQPLLTAMTYYVVFGKIANLSTDGLPPLVFYMSGTIVWNYFSACLTNNSETFSKNSNLFGKVYFPRIVVPLAVAMSGLVAFAIQFGLLIVVSLAFWSTGDGFALSWKFLFATPVIVISIATLGVGMGLIVSAATVKYRDLVYAISFVVQLWMYATPVVYTFSQVPARFEWLFYLNPMTAPVQTFRWAMYDTPFVPIGLCTANVGIIVAVLITGLVLFSRAERNAMDTV